MKKNYIAPSTLVQNVELENMIALSIITTGVADDSDVLVRDVIDNEEDEW